MSPTRNFMRDNVLQQICIFLTILEISTLSQTCLYHYKFAHSPSRRCLIQRQVAIDFGQLCTKITIQSSLSLLCQAGRYYCDWNFVQNLFQCDEINMSSIQKLLLLRHAEKNGCIKHWFDKVLCFHTHIYGCIYRFVFIHISMVAFIDLFA